MSNDGSHKSTGLEYSYFIMHTLFGVLFFFVWSQSINLFYKTGIDLFWDLFIAMFFSGILARIIGYAFMYLLVKKSKGIFPSFYRLNFQKSVNRISFISITATLLCCFIYSFGIDAIIMQYFFANISSQWSMLLSYLFIKLGTLATAWIFLKTRTIN